MKGKKAYLKTLEVVIAMVFTFAFVLYLMPNTQNTLEEDAKDILITLIQNEEFKTYAVNISSCVYKNQNTSINSILDVELKSYLNYSICPKGVLPVTPRKHVNVESLYLTGNITAQQNKVIKLYYWE